MTDRMDSYLDALKMHLKDGLAPFDRLLAVFSNMWVGLALIGVIFLLSAVYCIFCGRDSLRRSLRSPRALAICALMISLNIILSYFTLRFSAYLRIGFGFMTQPIVAILFGPMTACVTGMLQDIISLMLNPSGALLPAYTLSVGISGMLYGLILYKKPVTFRRVFFAKLCVILIGNVLFNSIALAPTAGNGMIGILPARMIKNMLMIPIQAAVCYLILKFLQRRGIIGQFEM